VQDYDRGDEKHNRDDEQQRRPGSGGAAWWVVLREGCRRAVLGCRFVVTAA
jgi:hypothetical protein